jgi:uncharacterized caspase-like protein
LKKATGLPQKKSANQNSNAFSGIDMRSFYISLFSLGLCLTPAAFGQEPILAASNIHCTFSSSDNGKFMTAFDRQNNLIYQVDLGTGSVISKQTIDFVPGQYLVIKPSYYGNYLMIISYSDYSFIEYFFYSFNGTAGFKRISSSWLGYSSDLDGKTLEIESNPNEDFTVKAFGESKTAFVYEACFVRYSEDLFYFFDEYSKIEAYGTTLEDNYVDELDNAAALFLDAGPDQYFLAVTDYRHYDNNPHADGEYAYWLVGKDITSGKNKEIRLFNESETHSDENHFYDLSFEAGALSELKYDARKQLVYGHGLTKEVLTKVVFDYQADFDEAFYDQLTNYYREWENNHIPFIYDLATNQFTTILRNKELALADDRNNTFPIPAPVRAQFAFNLDYAFYICLDTARNISLYSIDLLTGTIDSLKTAVRYDNVKIEITHNNKAIFTETMRSDNGIATGLKFSMYDLETLTPRQEMEVLAKNSNYSIKQIALHDSAGYRSISLYDNNKVLVRFNPDRLPFFERTDYSTTSEISGQPAQVRPEPFDSLSTRLNQDSSTLDAWICLPGTPPYVKWEDLMRYQHSFQQSIEEFDMTSEIPFNYDFEEYEQIFRPDFSTGEDEYDSDEAKAYVNVLYSYDCQVKRQWHPYSQHLFVTNYSTIDKYNPETGTTDFVYLNHKTPVLDFDILAGDSLMASVSTDGAINFWNIFSNQLIATLYLFDEGREWIFILPDNYYYGTPSAIENVAFAFDKKVLPVEYFELRYNRPDLVLKALESTNTLLIDAYYKAYLKRLKKLGLTEDMLKLDYDVPFLEISNREMIPLETNEPEINIDLNLYDLRYNIDRINVWVNDVALYGREGLSIKHLELKKYETSLAVPLGLGDNKIEVSAMNSAGSESFKSSFAIRCNTGKPIPDLYLLTIGVSKYIDSRYNLTYAAKDATDLSAAFNNTEYFDTVYTKSLLNEDVTLEKLAELKSFFDNAGINDQVIIFVAGHGILDANFDYYFASHDMDFGDPAAHGIPYETIEGLLNGIRPLKKLLLMDTCHSGEVDKDEIQASDEKNESQDDIVFRNVGAGVENKENQLGLQNTSELMKSLFTDLRKGTGSTVISSSGGVEFSMESEQWQNGLFTYCLINGLTSRAADLNQDSVITVSELQHYVQSEVSKLSNGRQTPTSRIVNQQMNYRIW